jgi:4-methylaminobutanoate oxidase (formaldehyde-forming)
MGPRSRAVLAAVCADDLSGAATPFGSVRDVTVAGQPVRALRVSYVGELGWELHAPVASAAAVFDALMAAGAAHGIRPAGYRAIESLRLEKGYRAWGADITPTDSPFEAGLGWAVKLASGIDFLGRDAAAAIAAAPLKRCLVVLSVADPAAVLVGRETILRDGQPVGYLTSGGWGYTVECNIGYGYVRNPDGVDDAWLRAGRYALVVAGDEYPAALHLEPLYDPLNTRVRG